MAYMGVQSLITLVSHIFFICLTFWAMQSLRTDTWIRKYHIPQARMLYVLIAIAIGYNVSSFFIEFLLSSQNLMYLF
jgi:uncharacterized integral membrane protein (TIGR02327 family)